MVEGNHADATGFAAKLLEHARQRVRVEAFDRVDMHIDIGPRRALNFELMVQHLHEGVGADRQHEVETNRCVGGPHRS